MVTTAGFPRTSRRLMTVAIALASAVPAWSAAPRVPGPAVTHLVTGLQGASGSTIGPGGALYVTEGATGRILRVDPQTGQVTVFASGLPPSLIGIGGAIDVAFLGSTAYALVTLVGFDVGGSSIVGIYRVDGPTSFTVIADLGQFSALNPPSTPFDLPTGLQYALDVYRGGFLVTDGHHNRVLHVTLNGEVSEFRTFGNVVPTGLAIAGNTIYLAEAGPVPHLPQDGKVIAFGPRTDSSTVASGARLLVDVELGRGVSLFALSQGIFPAGNPAGSPALPNTGALVQVNDAGGLDEVVGGLNLPTSLEFIGDTAYVVTLAGDILRIDSVSSPPYGRRP
jgi:hypothetical protein